MRGPAVPGAVARILARRLRGRCGAAPRRRAIRRAGGERRGPTTTATPAAQPPASPWWWGPIVLAGMAPMAPCRRYLSGGQEAPQTLDVSAICWCEQLEQPARMLEIWPPREPAGNARRADQPRQRLEQEPHMLRVGTRKTARTQLGGKVEALARHRGEMQIRKEAGQYKRMRRIRPRCDCAAERVEVPHRRRCPEGRAGGPRAFRQNRQDYFKQSQLFHQD